MGEGVTREEAMAHNADGSIPGAEDYMGLPVTAVSMKITKAGDGLSKQLAVEPRVLIPGQKYRVLLEGIASDHTHKPIPKAESWELVQVLEAETVTFVDDKASEGKIRVARDRVAKLEERKGGKTRLPGTDAADLEKDDDEPPGVDGKSAGAGERPEPDWNDDDEP